MSSARARERAFPLELLRRTGRALQRLPRSLAPALVLAWCTLIFLLSTLTRTRTGPSSVWSGLLGNLFHAFEYGLLALACALCLPRRAGWPVLDLRRGLAVLAFCALYGASDELHQAFVPGRSATPLDLLTDVVGAAGTLIVAAWVGRADAHARGLCLRLAGAALASLLAAALSTWLDRASSV